MTAGLFIASMLAALTSDHPVSDPAAEPVRAVITQERAISADEAEFAACVYEVDQALAFDIVSAKTQEDFEGAFGLATTVCPFEGSMSIAKLNSALLALFPDFDPYAEEATD